MQMASNFYRLCQGKSCAAHSKFKGKAFPELLSFLYTQILIDTLGVQELHNLHALFLKSL